jgi:hypothetical protein
VEGEVLDGLMAAPTPEEQIRFLTNIQRLLTEGAFTATYKYALLLSLADIAIEGGDESGAPLTVPTRRIAEKFIAYYWRHVVPFVPGHATGSGLVLQQNTDRQAAIVNHVAAARQRFGDSLTTLQRDAKQWKRLVTRVDGVVRVMPLWKLQRVGDEVFDFLYEQRGSGSEIQLRAGVAFCLRHFHPLITEIVRAAWVQYLRKVNAQALGSNADLADFLFGAARANIAAMCPMFGDLQGWHCFYCGGGLKRGSAHVDHFVPWARYPIDLGHNFVLSHDSCNGAKGMMLASEEHLGAWSERNRRYADQIADGSVRANIAADLKASVQIARWAYGQAFDASSLTWVRAKEMRRLSEAWECRLVTAHEQILVRSQ